MNKHLFPLILFLGLTLAGCESNRPEVLDEETTGPTKLSTEIIEAYQPRVVRLIEVLVNSTVTEPFPLDLYPQRYSADNWVRFERVPLAQWFQQNRTPPYDLDHKTIVSRDIAHLWRVQDN